MYYPEEVVEEVCAANDIVDIVGQAVKLKKKGAYYFGLCPFHNEKTPSFSVTPGKQIYHCFSCGAGGTVITFLMNYEGMTFQEALKSLADRAGIKLPEVQMSGDLKKKQQERERTLSLLKDAASFYYRNLRAEEGKEARQYFIGRGLSKNIMQSFGLGYAGNKNGVVSFLQEKGYTSKEIEAAGLVYMNEKSGMRDRFHSRVIFPIMDINNHVIGFGGRVMGKGEPKYLNSPETKVFDKGKNLYGLNEARKSRKGYLIACEGYMDVISMHQAGFTEAVASLGTAFTPDQARVLKRYTEEIRLSYDSDGPGIRAALRAIPVLKAAGLNAKVIHLEPYKDPDEFIKNLGREEFQKRSDEAEQSLSFEIHVMQKDYDLSDPEDRTRFQQSMAKRLAMIEDEIERINYTESFAAEYMISSDLLKRAVESARLMQGSGNDHFIRQEATVREVKKNTDKAHGGISEAEKLLLTFLSDAPDKVFKEIRQYIGPEDFSPGVSEKCAEMFFKDMDKGEVKISSIVSRFDEPEEQRQAAEMFNTMLDPALSNTEKENAVTDLVIKIKRDSLKRSAKEENADPISRTLKEKKALEKLETLKIRLDK